MKTYLQALHAMQSGVASMMSVDPSETQPKHLRVGVNSAMIDSAALARLLIRKGLFTLEEYDEALTETVNEEVKRYESKLSSHYNRKITLE